MDNWFGFKEGTKFQGLLGERFLSYKDGGWCLIDSNGNTRNPLDKPPVFTDSTLTTGMAVYNFNPEDRMKENTVQKYYTVVKTDFTNNTFKNRGIKYELDKFVYPYLPGDYSIVYDTLLLAQSEKDYRFCGESYIYECEIEGFEKHTSRILAYGVKIVKKVEDPEDDKIVYGDILENVADGKYKGNLYLVTVCGLLSIASGYKAHFNVDGICGLKFINRYFQHCKEYHFIKSKKSLVTLEEREGKRQVIG